MVKRGGRGAPVRPVNGKFPQIRLGPPIVKLAVIGGGKGGSHSIEAGRLVVVDHIPSLTRAAATAPQIDARKLSITAQNCPDTPSDGDQTLSPPSKAAPWSKPPHQLRPVSEWAPTHVSTSDRLSVTKPLDRVV
jgi:hypothetical protein